MAALLVLVGAIALTSQPAHAEDGGYPYAAYNGPGSNASAYWWTNSGGGGWSGYGFAYRNCTDFVAWKLNDANGLAFVNSTPHGLYGNANTWAATAEANGYTVNMTPAVGAVAWYNSNAHGMSAYGHVAWVSEVNGNNVTIQEYNNPGGGTWGTRTFNKNNVSGYIHFADINAADADADGVPDAQDWCPAVPGPTTNHGCPVPKKLFVVRTGTSIHGKAETLTSPWVWGFNATPVAEVRVTEERITYTTPTGDLWAKDKIDGPWINPGVVDQYAATPSMLVLRVGTVLHAKPGLLNDGTYPWYWSFNNQPALEVKAAGNRVAYRSTASEVWVRDSILQPWTNVGYAEEFAISESMIVLRSGSNLHAKAGLLTDPTPWYYSFQPSAATSGSLVVAGNRIIYRGTDWNVWMRDSINNPWTNLGPGEYALTPAQLVFRNASSLHAKTGLITDTTGWYWYINNEGASDVRAAGTRIAYTSSTSGKVWVRESLNQGWLDFGYVDQYAMS